MLLKDRLTITSKRTYTDEGFLVVPARIARTGIQEYYALEMGLDDREPTDIVRVYRPPEEVFKEDSLQSFANKTVTDNHPPELVNADNFKKYTVGHSGPEVTVDGMFATTLLTISDSEAIKKIESGKVELSNGYTSDIEWSPGISPDGESYDAIQTNIKGNHIAIVDRGRCGPSCRVSDTKPDLNEETPMGKITVDGVDFEVSEQAAQVFTNLSKRVQDAEEKAKDAEEEMKKKEDEEEEMKKDHQAQLDKMQAKLDDALSKSPTPEMLDQLVDNRIGVRDAAIAIDPEYKWEGKDCETIRKEIVSSKCETVDVEKVSPDYIRARFDMLAESYQKQPGNHLNDAIRKSLNHKDGDKVLNIADEARKKAAERARNAWKGEDSKGDK